MIQKCKFFLPFLPAPMSPTTTLFWQFIHFLVILTTGTGDRNEPYLRSENTVESYESIFEVVTSPKRLSHKWHETRRRFPLLQNTSALCLSTCTSRSFKANLRWRLPRTLQGRGGFRCFFFQLKSMEVIIIIIIMKSVCMFCYDMDVRIIVMFFFSA